MATIVEYGGSPSYAIRMEASKPKYGTQLSGYTGYIPGNKYTSGSNFPTTTQKLSSKFDNLKHNPVGYGVYDTVSNTVTEEYMKEHMGDLKNEMNRSLREQKYVFDLPPGYRGYIPKFEKNSLGLTFQKGNFKSIENQIRERQEQLENHNYIKNERLKMPSLKAIACDKDVDHGLEKIVDKMHPCGYPSQKGVTEAPIGGYMGSVPRTTSLTESFGMDFNKTATFGLKTFYCYQKYYQDRLDNPQVYLSKEVSKQRPSIDDDICLDSRPKHRLYPKDGMRPRYTGRVPGYKFDFGNTYGDSTRKMECCQHNEANFGIYMKKKLKESPIDYNQIIS